MLCMVMRFFGLVFRLLRMLKMYCRKIGLLIRFLFWKWVSV